MRPRQTASAALPWRRLALALALGATATAARAQSYTQTFAIAPAGGSAQSETLAFNPANPSSDLTGDAIQNQAYNDTGVTATTTIARNGVPIANFVSPAGNRAVEVTIPSIGQTVIFSGGSRAANYAQALAYTQAQIPTLFLVVTPPAFSSPTNPRNEAVGNPSALVPQMIARTFRVDTGLGIVDPTLPPNTAAHMPSVFTVGGEVSGGSIAGTGFWSFTEPFDYKYYFDNPQYSVSVDVPLTYLRVGNADVGLGSAGASFRFPILDNWSLSVGVRGGAVGSDGLSIGATAYAETLSSQYNAYFGDYKLTVGNAVGFVHTSGFRVNGGDSGPPLDNVPLVNGLGLEGSLPFTMFDRPSSFEAYVIDTYFAGRPIAIRHYDEIGIDIGTRSVLGEQNWNQARFGVAFTVGRSFQEGSLRFTYRF